MHYRNLKKYNIVHVEQVVLSLNKHTYINTLFNMSIMIMGWHGNRIVILKY